MSERLQDMTNSEIKAALKVRIDRMNDEQRTELLVYAKKILHSGEAKA